MDAAELSTVFVTGATGYIGGRLAPRLVERGYRVRCLARNAGKLRARPWAGHKHVEIVEGDAAEMVALAQRKWPGVEFMEGDAEKLALPDAEFDAVMMNFGVLVEGLCSETSRGDSTPIELFLDGVRVWAIDLRRLCNPILPCPRVVTPFPRFRRRGAIA